MGDGRGGAGVAVLFFLVLGGCGGSTSPGGGEGPDAGSGGEQPSLRVVSVQAPLEAHAGDPVEVTYRIWNAGTEDAQPVKLALALAHESAPRAATRLGPMIDFPGLRASAELQATAVGVLPGNLAGGRYLLSVSVASAGGVPDPEAGASAGIGISGASCQPDVYEDDDDASGATILDAGVGQAHDFCLDPEDWLRVEVEAGRSYEVVVAGASPPRLTLLDAEGHTLQSLAHTEGVCGGTLFWEADRSGPLWLRATAADGLYGTGSDSDWSVVFGPVLPELTVYATLPTPDPTAAEEEIWIDEVTSNAGGAGAAGFRIGYFLSQDRQYDDGDVLLYERDVPELAACSWTSKKSSVRIPGDVQEGTWSVLAVVDTQSAVAELDEANNTVVAGDVEVAQVSNPSILECEAIHTARQGADVTIGCDFYNTASASSPPTQARVQLSADTVADDADPVIGNIEVPGLLAWNHVAGYAKAQASVTLPPDASIGPMHLLVSLDPDDVLLELDETDNTAEVPISVVSASCLPDAFEEDDCPCEPPGLVLGVVREHNLCDDGMDHASLRVQSERLYTIEMTGAVGLDEVTMTDVNGYPVALTRGESSALFRAAADMTLLLHVGSDPAGRDASGYTLVVREQ